MTEQHENRFLRSIPVVLGVLLAIPLLAEAEDEAVIADKTLVAWVAPANVTQRGGSVLTLERPGGIFDAIVLGEIAPARWMAGSNSFSRTHREQDSWPAETAGSDTLVQVAIVYRDEQITLYRDGVEYADYAAGGAERFDTGDVVLLGLRHLDAGPENRFFVGAIEDARIYDVALDAERIAALIPDAPSDPKPLAWWDFEGGRTADRMHAFSATTLYGDARVADGRLVLETSGAFLLASNQEPRVGGPLDFGDVNRTIRAHREALLADPYRPGYHLVTPEGRCMPFDPNGAIFWKGRYHLFYIFQDHRGHNWGHVSSTDLFHWRHHPTGLVSGMFSGNCFLDEHDRPTMCYHQVGQGNALAVALDDELNEWEKLSSNPITPVTEPGDPHHDRYRSWDPYGWYEDGAYYAIFGGQRPAIAKADRPAGPWSYVGDLLANTVEGISIEEDVSCADFFEIGGRRMLLCISHRLGCRYYLGDWKDEQFHPDFHAMMSWADNSFFAPESLLDDRGRRIMWAWIFDGPGFETRTDHGWSGTMSLPRVLSLDDEGRLRMDPPEEIERLRYRPRPRRSFTVAADTDQIIEGVEGTSLELNVELRSPQAGQCGIEVLRSPDGLERTLVYHDAVTNELRIDTRESSLTSGARTVESSPLVLEPGEPLRLRVFVDRSVVEVFANGRQAVMRRVYPSRKDSVGVALFSRGGPAAATVEAWDVMPSNPF